MSLRTGLKRANTVRVCPEDKVSRLKALAERWFWAVMAGEVREEMEVLEVINAFLKDRSTRAAPGFFGDEGVRV